MMYAALNLLIALNARFLLYEWLTGQVRIPEEVIK